MHIRTRMMSREDTSSRSRFIAFHLMTWCGHVSWQKERVYLVFIYGILLVCEDCLDLCKPALDKALRDMRSPLFKQILEV